MDDILLKEKKLKEMIEISNDMANGSMSSWHDWKQRLKEEVCAEIDYSKVLLCNCYN